VAKNLIVYGAASFTIIINHSGKSILKKGLKGKYAAKFLHLN
jgi:hypothetical protein